MGLELGTFGGGGKIFEYGALLGKNNTLRENLYEYVWKDAAVGKGIREGLKFAGSKRKRHACECARFRRRRFFRLAVVRIWTRRAIPKLHVRSYALRHTATIRIDGKLSIQAVTYHIACNATNS